MNPELLEEYPLRERPWSSLTCLRVFSDFVEGMEPDVREKSPIRFPVGLVLVRSRYFSGSSALYKFPGGHDQKRDKTPLDTALREGYEETGIIIPRDRMKYAASKKVRNPAPKSKRPFHALHLFYADIYEHEARKMHNFHPNNGGENPELLTFAQIQSAIEQRQVMPLHLEMGREAGLLIPPFKTAA